MGALIREKEKKTEDVAEDEVVATGEQYLTFMVAKELFAIGIDVIREIIEFREPTTVPMMPLHVRGVINLRGRVVPVIDLSVRFGHRSTVVSKRTCIVILEIYHEDELHYLGVVVDAVKAVLEIADTDIEPPPSFGANLRNDFISGMGKIGEEFVVILDIEHVLSIEELATITEASSTTMAREAIQSDDEETSVDVDVKSEASDTGSKTEEPVQQEPDEGTDPGSDEDSPS